MKPLLTGVRRVTRALWIPWMLTGVSLFGIASMHGAESSKPIEVAKNHWAFRKPIKSPLPEVKQTNWGRTPIDRFVLARIEKEGLSPSAEADKITLLRRLHLDLIGLPPSIGEVNAFMADSADGAYERQVERLLNSPHFGERWGRHWLDAARYADSDGYEKDMSREMWPYRDYVIQALNHDLPYNQFIIEQIAGDLLPEASQDQHVATAFLRNSMVNMEGAIDPEQFRMESMFDRMDAVGKTFLGLTVQCAQCHNHKYDPITQVEYYRLFAFLNNDHESRPIVYTPDQLRVVTNLQREIAEIEDGLQHRVPDWEQRMAKWEDSIRNNQPEWIVISDLDQEGDKSQRYEARPDGSWLACGYAPTEFTQWFRVTNDLSGVTAFRLELMLDPNLPYQGPGRSFRGTCALTDFFVEATELHNSTNKVKVKWKSASADIEQPERKLEDNYWDKSTNNRVYGPIRFAIDGKSDTAWGIDVGPARRNQDRKAVFVADQPAGFARGTTWRIGLQQNHGGWNSDDHMNNNLGRFRLSATRATGELKADPLPVTVRHIVQKVPREMRTVDQRAAVFSYWRSTIPEWTEANGQIEKRLDQWPDAATCLTLTSREEPRMTAVLNRGDWLKRTTPVQAGVPAFLHPLAPEAPPTRLTLARWLADRESPTTARVIVNRIWQTYFGSGLNETPEDFGVRAPLPSHPELLDWLACELMDQHWSLKSIHRLIVNSAVYRQNSKITPESYSRDSQNRLLARGARFRVEGEIVRDLALASSGLLNDQIGGRSVMPPAPAFLFQPPASYAPFPWKDEEGPEKYRRALYTFRRRSTPHPALQTYDVPNADVSCVRRQRSNSPLQALVSLNEPVFIECAQSLARKTLAEGGSSDQERLVYAFRRVLAREPQSDELQDLTTLLEKERQRLSDGWLNPNEIGTGRSEIAKELPPTHSPTQVAAYTIVSRVILNLDEAITKE